MKKLTPADIKNHRLKTGYHYVHVAGTAGPNGGGDSQNRFYGHLGSGGRPGRWYGPRRATPEEAAQDYCDHVNGLPPSKRPKRLRSAGHKRNPRIPRRGPTPVEQRIAEVEKELRGLKRQREKESEGRQGYVYCIAESPNMDETFTAVPPVEGAQNRIFIIGARGVKIGHAVDPHKRIAELQTGNPRKLILIGFIKGAMEDEARLHQRFHKDNVLQEWFRPSRELLSLFVNKEG